MSPSTPPSPLLSIPQGSFVSWVHYEPAAAGDSRTPLVLDEADGRVAHIRKRTPITDWAELRGFESGGADLIQLTLPAPIESQADIAWALLEELRRWPGAGTVAPTLISLQGAHLILAPGLVAVLAAAETMDATCRAAVEVAFQEQELRDLEQSLGSGWSAALKAAPFAYEATPEAVRTQSSRAGRFLELTAMRGRHARLGPKIMAPKVYPPTVASQVGERVRERMKMWDRYELLDGHLESQEDIYLSCAERVSEYAQARRGHQLEWTIIWILALQSVFWVATEMMSAPG